MNIWSVLNLPPDNEGEKTKANVFCIPQYDNEVAYQNEIFLKDHMNFIYKKKCRGIWKTCVNEKDDEQNVQQ